MSDTRNRRRPVERDYFAALADIVTPDIWRDIVRETIDHAKSGDAKAREWITRFVLGEKPDSLSTLAMKEELGIQTEDEIVVATQNALEPIPPNPFSIKPGGRTTPTESPMQRLLRLKEERERRAQRTEPTAQNNGDN